MPPLVHRLSTPLVLMQYVRFFLSPTCQLTSRLVPLRYQCTTRRLQLCTAVTPPYGDKYILAIVDVLFSLPSHHFMNIM